MSFVYNIMLPVVIAIVAEIVYAVSCLEDSTVEPSVANSTGSRATTTLQFVVVVARHGNRGPIFEYPKTAYPAEDRRMWPYGRGQLTSRGRAKMYNLGRKIRSLYDGFLHEIYYDEDFKAYSTLAARTMVSAAMFSAGLYPPPKDFRMRGEQVAWQPVPVFPNYLDHAKYMVDSRSKCPRFREDQRKSISRFEEDRRIKLVNLFDYLQPHTGFNKTHIPLSYLLGTILDLLLCVEGEGLPLPSWSAPVFPEPMSSLIAEMFEANLIATDTMIRLFQGKLFQEIIGLMEAKATATMSPDRRMHYYSGHDATIIGLRGIVGLGGSGQGLVSPGSAFIFEMHSDSKTNDSYVEVLYINGNSTDMVLQPINVRGCGDKCQFDLLRNLTAKYYDISDHSKDCQIN